MTFPDITLVDEDFREGTSPPDDPPPDTGFRTDPDVPVCLECGNAIPWKGRGRKPLRHPECKKTGGSTSTRKPRAALVDPLDELVGTLQEGLGHVAGGISAVAPVTGMTILMTGGPAIDATVRVLEKYPRMMAAFQKAAGAVPYFDIARFAGGVIAAISVDTGRLLPEGLLMEYLSVADAAKEVGYVPPKMRQTQPVQPAAPVDASGMRAPAPPRFTMP